MDQLKNFVKKLKKRMTFIWMFEKKLEFQKQRIIEDRL